ncbi:MAG: SPOR domain-containing protein [Proteobacteria bacterium]|nr:SPOR domain-containing protein [Pseudomonadota bacterium]MBU1737675.1 SPOR domain-containing protein [Pseudomonadota bacterium]
MPPTDRKKKFSVQFELSLKGLLGAGIVCLCIFLWMFLLGVWAGQTILSSPPGPEMAAKKVPIKKKTLVTPAAEPAPEKAAVVLMQDKEVASPPAKEKVRNRPEPEEDPSFFSVQVAAFKDGKLAGKAVADWRTKGYDAFSRAPEGGGDSFTRVYIGRFDKMDAAKEYAEMLKKKEKQKPFIALVPENR